MDLHPLEHKVLEGLKKLGGKGTAQEVAQNACIEKIQAERFGYSLSQKNIVKLEKKTIKTPNLTKIGKEYLDLGLPEKRILKALEDEKLTLGELSTQTKLSEKEISASFSILKRNAWVSIMKTETDLEFEITSLGKEALGKKFPLEIALENPEKAGKTELEELKRRGLVSLESRVEYTLELIGKIPELESGEHQLTHEMLKTGSWKGKKFRSYDLNGIVPAFYGGKLHPLTIAINKIRRIFAELGFEEIEGPLVESSFWNFDALFQPQDHPARDLADTFYLREPEETKLPSEKVVDKVRKAHEHGIFGSRGWQYKWDKELSKRPVLRTHTTAVTARVLTKIDPPAKVFCIGRVFRNETVDYKHLPEFSQIDGIVVDKNVNFKNLLGYLKEFFTRLGFKKIRFRPAYFPYTEMSVEPEIYLESREEWVELGGAGIFRPEVTEPLGIKVPVLAWGLSLERPVMLKLGLDDLRNFYYKNDLKMLREVAVV